MISDVAKANCVASITQKFGIPNHNREETQEGQSQPIPATTTTESPPPRFSTSLNVAPPHPMNIGNQVPAPHVMDTLSWTALTYCLTAGLEFTAIVAQAAVPDGVSFRVQLMSLLLNVALCLLIAANGIYARTHPTMAYWMDRVGSVMVLTSSTIAALPSFPKYVSIACAGFMIILYAHQYFSSRVFSQPCDKKEQGERENSKSELDSVV